MVKRLFDIFFSLGILIVFFPFGLIIAFFIALESKGGIFYKQHRIGKNGVSFGLLKFRTMRPNSESNGQLTVGMRDPRITKVGFLLRKYKLDEFPQFLNVLKGQMSIVGPRPEVKKYVDLYTLDQRKVLIVKPGITDYASIEYFDENRILGQSLDPEGTYVKDIMPEKINLNMKYLVNPSLSHDIKIIWLTFKKVISG